MSRIARFMGVPKVGGLKLGGENREFSANFRNPATVGRRITLMGMAGASRITWGEFRRLSGKSFVADPGGG